MARIKRCLEAINRGINICSYLQLLSEKHKHLTHTHPHSPCMCNTHRCVKCVHGVCVRAVHNQTAALEREAKLCGGYGSALSRPPETVM